MTLSASARLLQQLLAFDTTSHLSNLELIRFVETLLQGAGISVDLVLNDDGSKANLWARLGEADRAGVVLSGHTDVVPVAGQAWSSDPFAARIADGKMYGRGTADMKGFIACAVTAMLNAAASGIKLTTPLYLSLSYDEEIGCIGVRGLLDVLAGQVIAPKLCVIGEPTLMQIATGHKGKAVFRACCSGEEGHSALAPQFTNAVHVAHHLVGSIIDAQQAQAEHGARDGAYDIPYTTLHIGKIHGGKALNIVPNECVIDFEIRHLPEDSPARLVEHLLQASGEKNAAVAERISIECTNEYPGLDTPPTADAVAFLQNCLPPQTKIGKIAFGTEGGLFQGVLDCPVLVCGPGSIRVAHKPDEYVELAQLDACDDFLARLLACLH